MAHPEQKEIPVALTIAGSDSGGGAGIQADLKTFAALGVYGLSAVTAVTAQNTVGVTGVFNLPADFVAEQIKAMADDFTVNAVKTGMLSTADIVAAVAGAVKAHGFTNLVVDPVMVAKSNDPLLLPEAVQAVKELLLPLADVVTPNLPEAAVLAGMEVKTLKDMKAAAEKIFALGPKNVVVKGGHLKEEKGEGESTDLFFDGETFQEITAQRHDTPHTHGTGCTFASAIAAGLARGMTLPKALLQAKWFISEAIQNGLALGRGHGPTHHFARLYRLARMKFF